MFLFFEMPIILLYSFQLEDLQKLTGENLPLPTPQYLYELQYSERGEAAFEQRRGGRKIIHAYHGSKPENFYSITHHGLHAHMNKVSVITQLAH